MSLMKPFHTLSNRWVEEQAKHNDTISLKTLAGRALNDAKTFERLEAGGNITVPVYEKLMDFLDTPANWPGRVIPDDVARALQMVRSVALAA